jgi:hypothetical protein
MEATTPRSPIDDAGKWIKTNPEIHSGKAEDREDGFPVRRFKLRLCFDPALLYGHKLRLKATTSTITSTLPVSIHLRTMFDPRSGLF